MNKINIAIVMTASNVTSLRLCLSTIKMRENQIIVINCLNDFPDISSEFPYLKIVLCRYGKIINPLSINKTISKLPEKTELLILLDENIKLNPNIDIVDAYVNYYVDNKETCGSITTTITNNSGDIINTGFYYLHMNNKIIALTNTQHIKDSEHNEINGAERLCLAIPYQLFKDGLTFDRNMRSEYFSDAILSIEIKKMGYKNYILSGTTVKYVNKGKTPPIYSTAESALEELRYFDNYYKQNISSIL